MKYFRSAAILGSLVALAFSVSGMTATKKMCDGFLPPNDVKIPVGNHSYIGMRNNGGVTEAEYNKIMDRIQALYENVVKQKGGSLVINRLWTDSTVNSSAEQQGNRWIINMYGGIARHPDTTVEGEALIACHEMGHHLGGAPKINSMFGGAWATNEGGADYFATLKCLRDFFAQDNNSSILANANIDPLAKSQCLAQFKAQNDQDLCMRISMSSESVSYLFQDLSSEKTRPQFSTPDTSTVSRTNDAHPATQCRMDTYFSGSLCPVATSVNNSDTDVNAGSCVQGTDALGFRPRCWFSPTTGGGGGGGGKDDCPVADPNMCKLLCQLDPTQPFCKN